MADRGKGITSFEAENMKDDYAARIARAKGTKVPLGGVAMPQVPRLDQAPPDRGRGVQSQAAAAKVLTPEQQQALAEQGKLRQGVGSAYAQNQPGFDPNQQAQQPPDAKPENFVNPPRPEGAGLRPETVQGLEQLAKVQETDKELKKELDEIDELDDTFELDENGNRVRTPLNNKKRREAIEARCSALSIDDLISHGEVRQKVSIIPGVFEPIFRSVSGDESLFIKRLMATERNISDQYIFDKYSLLNLTAGLHALNGSPLPSHLDSNGDPDEKLFKEKFKKVSKLPLSMLTDLSVNYVWFNKRIEKLFVVDNIKDF